MNAVSLVTLKNGDFCYCPSLTSYIKINIILIGTIDLEEDPELGEWDWWDELRRQIDGDYGGQQSNNIVVPHSLAIILIVIWLANILFWLWRCSYKVIKMKTPARTSQRFGLVKISASVSKNHKSTETSESISIPVKDQIKDIVKCQGDTVSGTLKDVNEAEKSIGLSTSKSDYCIRYEKSLEKIVDSKFNGGDAMSIKMPRATSGVHEKCQNGVGIPVERLSDDVLAVASGYCDSCKMRLSNDQTSSSTGRHLRGSLDVAPPPPGYYLRDDISTENSLFDKKRTEYAYSKGDVPYCTFGHGSWTKLRGDDKIMDENLPIRIGDSMMIHNKNISPEARFSYLKKRLNKAGSKETPKKKIKKIKKRKTSRTRSIEYGDQSPKKAKPVDDRNQSKKSFDLKSGIIFKHVSKTERTHPLRYKQKILDPNNSKFYQTMGSLPVSMDSVLYYYEPQGKTKCKRNTSQNRNIEKTKKVRGNPGDGRQDPKGLSWKKVRDKKGAVYLNTNGNANNTSETDLPARDDFVTCEINSKTLAPEPAYNEITGIVAHAQAFQEFNDTIQTESVGDVRENDYSVYSDTNTVEMTMTGANKSGYDKPQLLTTRDGSNTQYGLDLMVDDILQSAYNEEAEFERCLTEASPEKPSREIAGKTPKSATFSKNLEESKTIDSQQDNIMADDENAMGPNSKPLASRPDLIKMCKVLKRVSSSSPNLSMARKAERAAGGKQTFGADSPLRSKSTPQTNKVSFSSQGSRNSQNSPQLPSKLNCKKTNLIVPIKSGSCGSEFDETGLNESPQEKQRGRPKKSREDSAPGSILRKSKSVPQGEKRTQSQPVKSQRKRKSTGSLKKSHSMSPGPFKGSGTSSPSGQISIDNPRKKLGKKNKKKVRIVVDWPRFKSDHMQKVTGIHESRKHCSETGLHNEYCEEKHSDCDLEGESPCDIECDAGVESKDITNQLGFESEEKEEQESDLGQEQEKDNEYEEKEKKRDEVPCNIMCGFSEGMKDLEPFNNSLVKESAIDPKRKVKKPISLRGKKLRKPKEDKSVAEKGWDSNFVIKKEDSKSKLVTKKKRYQLRKIGEVKSKANKHNVTKETSEIDPSEDRELDSPVDVERQTNMKAKKFLSPPINKVLKPQIHVKKPYLSPTGLRRKFVAVDPRGEGSSVDAPAFNARRESVVRLSKSGPILNAVKPGTREAPANQPRQRVKQARENFARMGRNKPNSSPLDVEKFNQTSPKPSRSTDLDVVCYKRQQPSPSRGSMSVAKASSTESTKLGFSKPRAKSEFDNAKYHREDTVEEETEISPPRTSIVYDHTFSSNPMEMNAITLGLQWVAQRLMRRLSYFRLKTRSECEVPYSSPVLENIGAEM